MNKWQRGRLNEVMELCSKMGGELDYTATSHQKLIDRQQSLGDIARILYSILVDCPENENRGHDRKVAHSRIGGLHKLSKKDYPDRNGNI